MKSALETIGVLAMLIATWAYLPTLPALKVRSVVAAQNVAAEQWVSAASWPLQNNQNGISQK